MEDKPEDFSITNRLRSFQYAFNGFKLLLRHEHNARLHLVVAIVIVFLGFLFRIAIVEWLFIVFAVGFVFVAETFNTCIEELCNFVCAEHNAKIKKIKDLAALAVLISAITAVIIGLVVFLPKLVLLF